MFINTITFFAYLKKKVSEKFWQFGKKYYLCTRFRSKRSVRQ